VTLRERSPKPPRTKARFFATIRALLHLRGRGVPSTGRYLTSRAAAAPLVCATLAYAALLAAPAFAEAPSILRLSPLHVYPTRAFINPVDPAEISEPGGAEILLHGLESTYRFEYAPAESGHAPPAGSPAWLPAGSGTVPHKTAPYGTTRLFLGADSPEDGGGNGAGGLHHLDPNTAYYVRLELENADGKNETTISFTTPAVSQPEIYCIGHELVNPAVCQSSFRFLGGAPSFAFGTTFLDMEARVETNGADTKYSFEYSESESGPWLPFTEGASGTITKAEDFAQLHPKITGLAPETDYFGRLTATSHCRASEPTFECTVTDTTAMKTKTIKPIVGNGLVVTAIGAESAHALDTVYPGTFETHWRFEASGEENGSYAPVPGAEGTIAAAEAGEKFLPVQAELSGFSPGSPHFVRVFAENVNGTSISGVSGFETAGPPSEVTTFATHALHGESLRLLGSLVPHTAPVEGGSDYDTHYHFEYEPAAGAGEPFANAASTPEIDLGAGVGHQETVEPKAPFFTYDDQILGADLPPLAAGVSYRYRLVARNDTPGDPVVRGNEQTLVVPVPAVIAAQPPCPNQAFRSGPAAALPDCRGYEQITPVNKEGAQEIYNYNTTTVRGLIAGEDGDQLMLEAPSVSWPGAAGGSGDPYFFTRTGPGVWGLTAGSPQPETGFATLTPALFAPDLSAFAFESGYNTSLSPGPGESPTFGFNAGPAGGPYPVPALATVPRNQVDVQEGRAHNGWVAASRDLSKLILAANDRNLLPGPETGTHSGADLYEYSEGQWRQVNVLTGGTTIGSCGASVARGREDGVESHSSPNAVSADGSRVFFEAVPSANCSEPAHLYVRLNGAETIDLGAYRFAAANSAGTELLLDRTVAGSTEFFLSAGAGAPVALFSAKNPAFAESGGFEVSKDLGAVYFLSAQRLGPEAPAIAPETGVASTVFNLYRYDVGARTLHFVAQTSAQGPSYLSPDGRYYYFEGPEAHNSGGYGVAGLPGKNIPQAFRYDSATDVIQCISCASPFDPEPRLNSSFGGRTWYPRGGAVDGTPTITFVSGDGHFAFFSTPSRLVAADLDGEHRVESVRDHEEHGDEENETSVSSDIYEWRADGVDGCGQIQGCLALITDGRGGFQNLLLGTADEGRDVFFSTASRLVSSDNDTAIDIYDARIGGGSPPPPSLPVECEASACSIPPGAPNDATPSSLTFTGAGNVLQPAPVATRVTTRTAAQLRAERLTRALRSCRRKHKRRARSSCERQARSAYRASARKVTPTSKGAKR
jgi:hypothetical protein